MPMRLQELHPAMVHFPIALVPAALTADALGRATGSQALMDTGRRLMPIAAASAALAGVFGVVAQQSVKTNDRSTPLLTTHRNLNLALIGLSAAMASGRSRRRRPGLGYLLLGAAGTAAMTYSAYLGGKMVYEYGVGVKPAGGLLRDEAPEITMENAGEVTRLAAKHVKEGVKYAVSELASGDVVPTLTGAASES